MKNWQEEFEKKFITIPDYTTNIPKIMRGNLDDVINFISQVEQDAYKRGLEDKEKVKQNYKDANAFIKDVALLLDDGADNLGYDGIEWSIEDFENAINKKKQEGIKKGLKQALQRLYTQHGFHLLKKEPFDLKLFVQIIEEEIDKL